MSSAELLARYLRQRKELGENELIFNGHPLDGMVVVGSGAFSDATSKGGEADPDRSPSRSRAPAGVPERASPPSDHEATAFRRPSPTGDALADASRPSALPVVGAVGVGPLVELKSLAEACTACGLASSRRKVVFGEGNAQAEVLVVGEAPGADEDASGRPFVGAAGRLLDLLLASAGLPRESVYICNVLKCRPPGNRNPVPIEVDACSHLLHGQISAIRPKAILACGTFAAQTLLGSTDALGKLRKVPHVYQGVPLIPTYHPAALLRNPSWVRSVWADLQRLRQILDA